MTARLLLLALGYTLVIVLAPAAPATGVPCGQVQFQPQRPATVDDPKPPADNPFIPQPSEGCSSANTAAKISSGAVAALSIAVAVVILAVRFSNGAPMTDPGNRRARNSGNVYRSEEEARSAALKYAGQHKSCEFRGLCSSGDHYHVDKSVGGRLVHVRHYYF